MNPFIIITGMHRSGTSFLARALNLYGVHLGNLESEWDVSWFEDLAKEVQADKVFGSMSNGKLFNIKRELHRGMTDTF